jgi:hypothetical protein
VPGPDPAEVPVERPDVDLEVRGRLGVGWGTRPLDHEERHPALPRRQGRHQGRPVRRRRRRPRQAGRVARPFLMPGVRKDCAPPPCPTGEAGLCPSGTCPVRCPA